MFLLVLFAMQSCDTAPKKGPVVDESKLTDVKVRIHRYGKALFEADTANFLSDINKIQSEFSLFLGDTKLDTNKIEPLYEYVKDTQLISLSNNVMTTYPDLSSAEAQLSKAFSRFQYFFPDKKIPNVYTYISNLYFQEPIIFNDSALIIGLDDYLGRDFLLYRSIGIPNYKIRCMTPSNIPVDVMKKIYTTEIAPRHQQKTLVDRMVAAGKLLFYLDAVLPQVPDSVKVCYSSEQINWIENNKKNVWAFFVDNNLFYSSDYKIQTKFIQDGPFTAGFSKNSPSRIGIWFGWQIVRKYMENHPEVTLVNLINNTDSQAIFNQSGYKP